MKRAAQFLADLWPVIAFYIAVILVVFLGVLKHPEQWITQPPKPAFSTLPSDYVKPEVSCYVRNNFEEPTPGNEGYCQPKRFDI
jgi:hypothetical protein